MIDPNTPIIAGVAQKLWRDKDPAAAVEPLVMMRECVEAAAEDAGAPALVGQLESIRVIRGMWKYDNPGGWLREQFGVSTAETTGTPFGGNMVQSTVIATANEILRGERSLVAITGAENGGSFGRARKAGVDLPVTATTGSIDRMIGTDAPMASDAEMARDLRRPIQVYPMFENALRHARGESLDDHLRRVSELWANFSRVAARNPNAWLQTPVSAEVIRTPGPGNRPVSYPYPKLMNSNNAVDMGAALIMCSVAKARALGIPEDQWVYPWAGTEAHDHYFVAERDNLYTSPAIRLAGERLFTLAGLDGNSCDFLDVYSCFPSAVQVAAAELGLDMSRELTVTGGLTFGGGPLNNYVMHSIARTVELLREAPSKTGLVTANGGYLTKHAFCIYSGEPPAAPFQSADVQTAVDATPKRPFVVDYDGDVTIESYTVMYDGEGPAMGHIACLTPEGVRTFANSADRGLAAAMTEAEFCGRAANVDGAGSFTMAG